MKTILMAAAAALLALASAAGTADAAKFGGGGGFAARGMGGGGFGGGAFRGGGGMGGLKFHGGGIHRFSRGPSARFNGGARVKSFGAPHAPRFHGRSLQSHRFGNKHTSKKHWPGKWAHHHHRRHRHIYPYIYAVPFAYGGYYAYSGYNDECSYYRWKWETTGSLYWRERYYECVNGYAY